MKTYLDCYPCFLRQALDAARMTGADERQQEGEEVELVCYTTCGGCPGGNVEYAPAEMKKNGAEVIHLMARAHPARLDR